MNNNLTVPDGHEIRVEEIRLYPLAKDHTILRQLQDEVRNCTNHIIRSRDDVKAARKAYALKNGFAETAPLMPVKPTSCRTDDPILRQQLRTQWKEYHDQVKSAKPAWAEWFCSLDKYFHGKPEFSWRDDTYQYLRELYGVLGNSHLFRDTLKRVSRTACANHKRDNSNIPLIWNNAPPIRTGLFYGTRRGIPWYNALIKVNGMQILGRLRRPLPGKVVQGYSIYRRADGWYAAVKCIVLKRKEQTTTLDPIGLDVGQTDIVALSNGYTYANPRNADHVRRIADIQSRGDTSADYNIQQDHWNQVGRLHQKRKRQVTNWLGATLLPMLACHHAVFIEAISRNFKSDKGPLSCIHIVIDAIKSRLQHRAIEVNCAFTSQTCSCCGHVDKSARKGKIYACTNEKCGAVLDADVNAACIIRLRGLALQRSY